MINPLPGLSLPCSDVFPNTGCLLIFAWGLTGYGGPPTLLIGPTAVALWAPGPGLTTGGLKAVLLTGGGARLGGLKA